MSNGNILTNESIINSTQNHSHHTPHHNHTPLSPSASPSTTITTKNTTPHNAQNENTVDHTKNTNANHTNSINPINLNSQNPTSSNHNNSTNNTNTAALSTSLQHSISQPANLQQPPTLPTQKFQPNGLTGPKLGTSSLTNSINNDLIGLNNVNDNNNKNSNNNNNTNNNNNSNLNNLINSVNTTKIISSPHQTGYKPSNLNMTAPAFNTVNLPINSINNVNNVMSGLNVNANNNNNPVSSVNNSQTTTSYLNNHNHASSINHTNNPPTTGSHRYYHPNTHNNYINHHGMVRYDRYKYNSSYRTGQDKQGGNGKNEQPRYLTLTIGSEGKVRHLAPEIWNYTFITRLVMKENLIRQIPNEISRLKTLLMLDISHNSIKTLPITIGELLELRELNISYNKIRNLPTSIGRLFHLQNLNLDGNDKELVNKYNNKRNGVENNTFNNTQNILNQLYSEYIRHTYLDDQYNLKPDQKASRDWIAIRNEHSVPVVASANPGSSNFGSIPKNVNLGKLLNASENKDTNNYNNFEHQSHIFVMTYNILSEKYATSQQYGYCPHYALDWGARRELLLEDIIKYEPDIICLQELEKRVYEKDFRNQLSSNERINYCSLYSQKSRAKNMADHHQEHVDGCAIFYKRDTLLPIAQYTVDFNKQANLICQNEEYQDQLSHRMSSKDNIGLIVLFEYTPTGNNNNSDMMDKYEPQYLIVVNAHLHWDPEFADIKIIQSVLLTNAIYNMRVQATKSQSNMYHHSSSNTNSKSSPVDDLVNDIFANKSDDSSEHNHNKKGRSTPVDSTNGTSGTSGIGSSIYNSPSLNSTPSSKNLINHPDHVKNQEDHNKDHNNNNNGLDNLIKEEIYFLNSNHQILERNIKPEDIPVIIGGDFNSLPESGVLDFMLDGKVNLQHPEFFGNSFPKHFTKLDQQPEGVKKHVIKEKEKLTTLDQIKLLHQEGQIPASVLNTKQKERKNYIKENELSEESNLNEFTIHEKFLAHPLNLKTAYENCVKGTPFTNYTYDFKGIIDYIFYSQDNLNLEGILQGISEEWFEDRKIPGCPFLGFPSDHLLLLAEFSFKNIRKLQNNNNNNLNGVGVSSNNTNHTNINNSSNVENPHYNQITNRQHIRSNDHSYNRDLDRRNDMLRDVQRETRLGNNEMGLPREPRDLSRDLLRNDFRELNRENKLRNLVPDPHNRDLREFNVREGSLQNRKMERIETRQPNSRDISLNRENIRNERDREAMLRSYRY